ncbi:RecB family exonuclease [Streptacidiphilus sp. EB129]|uniref:RecB family exonuclease n=1 Tax=Streptacidiphilus sp. EB129 TaxID=3156262 RepID=UPI00351134A2
MHAPEPAVAVRPAEAPVALSPSRAGDFMTCPLMYRLKVIDRIPEPPSAAATRGTVVHAVLERLFDAPAGARTPEAARALLRPQWERLLEQRPELADLFPVQKSSPVQQGSPVQNDDGPAGLDGEELARWLGDAERLLDGYFRLEDPNRLEPAERELYVETELDSGLRLRGYIDRVDVAPTGEIRVVDYKTGRAPSRDFEGKAMFQMKFYALVLWRLRGVVPRRLQLVYLGGGGQLVSYDPTPDDLLAVERKLLALWAAVQRALASGEWPANPNRLCDWCSFKALCPAFGGTPPPYPLKVAAAADGGDE